MKKSSGKSPEKQTVGRKRAIRLPRNRRKGNGIEERETRYRIISGKMNKAREGKIKKVDANMRQK